MASKAIIDLADDTASALDGFAAGESARDRTADRSLPTAVKGLCRSQALEDLIVSWEAQEGPIDDEHIKWADKVLARHGTVRDR